jgi:hypothetical protein
MDLDFSIAFPILLMTFCQFKPFHTMCLFGQKLTCQSLDIDCVVELERKGAKQAAPFCGQAIPLAKQVYRSRQMSLAAYPTVSLSLSYPKNYFKYFFVIVSTLLKHKL